jgi:uncharacterized membrane protein YgdD (TMEM256/DUF423 family)
LALLEEQDRDMKLLHALALFATVSLALAKEFFEGLGIRADYPVIGALGLAITTLLIFRSLFAVLGVVLLTGLVVFSPDLLVQYHLDRDVLLAAALTIILFPWISRMVREN